MDSDNENLKFLIQQLQEGSERAFTILYDKFSKQLYRNILRLVKDEFIAQELLQDLFLKVWENRQSIKIEGSFKSFLFKVAENLVFMYFRKVAKDNRLIENLIRANIEFDINAEEIVISRQDQELLYAAIAKLPPQRKQVYTLCKLEGKSYEEVSKELGISTSTISDHIVKANKTVKQFLQLNNGIALLFIVDQVIFHK
ncbi:RNA polymerase sigma factor [Mucilaginibacter segetis]|uniref:Sigma-70 family RNA polymerase sigma factor n=1 Tax=Mucilaginibacter segetis TaxID=2793071 RepID=A0A934UNM3_9SPHI|nr:sigma-70 family RNA polymerase sigma factor [Mucilaginibacter segetis]MBK0380062.1 sigma-70 family RNA polymerase sigma factor [Mucilaginibacter segetis]